ncbi:MAG TPA: phosphatase PAP2 family protein [Candidatus Methanoperedenaceae archaeon]|nr:phosphatase PAP2 family protein [Candidatus Methanoperedenaceae archaeon]
MIPFLAAMTMLGVRLFVPKEYRVRKQKRSLRRVINGYWPYMVAAGISFGLVQLQYEIRGYLNLTGQQEYTALTYSIEGSRVAVFQSFVSPYLTYAMSFIYLILFSFIIIFTFVLFIYTDNIKGLERYTIIFMMNYTVALPFYIFFPLKVTGFYLQGMEPLLYNLHPVIYDGVRSIDPYLTNNFPSLHTSLSLSALLAAVYYTDMKKYKVFTMVSTVLVIFSIFYLGIHWLTDMLGGILLAVMAFWLVTRYDRLFLGILHRIAVRVEKILGIKDTVVCPECETAVKVTPHEGHVPCPRCGNEMRYHPILTGRA